MAKKQPEKVIEAELQDVLALQNELAQAEAELMQIDAFRRFVDLQKTFNEQSQKVWQSIEEKMLENDIKTIKGEWGSLTIVNRNYFNGDIDVLDDQYVKRTPDTKAIAAAYKLEGELPKGATINESQYLLKKLKG